jgi:hypothetical protein
VTVALLVTSAYLLPSFTLRAQTKAPPPIISLDHETSQALFTLYDAGRYDDFDRRLDGIAGLLSNPFDFEWEADAWIGAPPGQERRRLVVAAVALEVARVLENSAPLTSDPNRARLAP